MEFATAFLVQFAQARAPWALMIPYLREKSFLDFVGAPERSTATGYFVIRPEGEEWAAWIACYRSRYGEKIVAGMIERGFMLTRLRRWPEERGEGSNDGAKRETRRVFRPPVSTVAKGGARGERRSAMRGDFRRRRRGDQPHRSKRGTLCLLSRRPYGRRAFQGRSFRGRRGL